MRLIFYVLLMLRAGCCTDDEIFETKTVGVGHNVTLICPRQHDSTARRLFWIRFASGNLLEVLGRTFSFDHENDDDDDDEVNRTLHIRTKKEPGTYVLNIPQTKPTDTGFYYCLRENQLEMTILKGVFLTIKGPEPDITTVIQVPSSDPVRPGHSVNLQCSVLSGNKTCPGAHSVYWFRAGSDESNPSVIYADGVSGDDCEQRPEAPSPHKCVYSFSKNISSSDAGTYYCAVASCGEILFGNGAKLNIPENSDWNLQTANTAVCILSIALVISLMTHLILICMKKKSCCSGAALLKINASHDNDDQQSQRNQSILIYSAPTFTNTNARKEERRKAKPAAEETVYSGVKTQR